MTITCIEDVLELTAVEFVEVMADPETDVQTHFLALFQRALSIEDEEAGEEVDG